VPFWLGLQPDEADGQISTSAAFLQLLQGLFHSGDQAFEIFWNMVELAPYILTARIQRPKRLVYLSSGLHRSGDANLKDLAWEHRPWNGQQAYSDTKLHDVLLAFAIARRWPDVLSNALEPGWVATKMGGPAAPDDLDAAHRTQVWLAVSDDPAAMDTGKYFYHMRLREPHRVAQNPELQEALLDACKRLSGVDLPAS
jgi:NAD(P)-dependent dehydrogenase (short-subunit alcohol dehydrogenase family)